MGRWLAAVGAALGLFLPVSPARWWPEARRLAAGCGWEPAMLLWASFGVILGLPVLGWVAGVGWLAHVLQLTWASW